MIIAICILSLVFVICWITIFIQMDKKNKIEKGLTKVTKQEENNFSVEMLQTLATKKHEEDCEKQKAHKEEYFVELRTKIINAAKSGETKYVETLKVSEEDMTNFATKYGLNLNINEHSCEFFW